MGRGRGTPGLLALLALLALLVCALAPARGQDFSLSDALDNVQPSKKPSPATKKPPSSGEFDLTEALDDDDSVKPNLPKPKPDHKGDTGSFSDDDLKDGTQTGGHEDRNNGDTTPADSPGVIPGIVSAVVVALAGAVSSFIAYQKKKLCFKGNEDPENVNVESHHGSNTEPPVQRTLLQK